MGVYIFFSNHNLLSINATMPIYTYYIRSRIIKSVKYCAYIMVYMYNISHPIIRIFAHQDMHAKDGYNLRVFSFSNRLISELSIYEKSTVTEDLSPCGGAATCFVFLMNDECYSCQLFILFFFSPHCHAKACKTCNHNAEEINHGCSRAAGGGKLNTGIVGNTIIDCLIITVRNNCTVR